MGERAGLGRGEESETKTRVVYGDESEGLGEGIIAEGPS